MIFYKGRFSVSDHNWASICRWENWNIASFIWTDTWLVIFQVLNTWAAHIHITTVQDKSLINIQLTAYTSLSNIISWIQDNTWIIHFVSISTKLVC